DLAAVGSCSVSAISDVNQRSGAGTNFSVAGTLAGGSSADVDGQTVGADGLIWYRLTTGSWVRSDVVTAETACSQVAVVMP
ncbi:MAG: SH3 domain-containing protein, partial [Burkholderiales bacterium]|nr:SH3 domain-containing protein [Anaerolineae bacterium]